MRELQLQILFNRKDIEKTGIGKPDEFANSIELI